MESYREIVTTVEPSTVDGSESKKESGEDETNSSTNEITAKLHDFSLASPKASSCCMMYDDEFKLQCLACNKLVHSGCTQLPVFQISHFLTKGYRRYICKEIHYSSKVRLGKYNEKQK